MPKAVALPDGHPLAGPVGEFLVELAAAGRSPHTVRGYRGDLARFATAHPVGLDQIDAAALRSYLAGLAHLAPATRARARAALASFLTWCHHHDLLDTDPMAGTEPITVEPAPPRGVDPAAVERVLAAIPADRLRDRVLFTLIARTGLRPAETLSADVTDVDLTAGEEHLTVTATGGRTRTVRLDDPALVALLHRHIRATGHSGGPLFRATKNHVGGPLRYSSAEQLWGKYRTTAGENISLRQLRHAHATTLLTHGVPIHTVRERLGHRHATTTRRYTRPTQPTDETGHHHHRRTGPTAAPATHQRPSAPPSPPRPAATPASRSGCPACGATPTTRAEAYHQREDLSLTWLTPGPGGQLTETHHCTGCAPTGPTTSIDCTCCGDGPLLAGDPPRDHVQTWLATHGWRPLPDHGLLCPTCAAPHPVPA